MENGFYHIPVETEGKRN